MYKKKRGNQIEIENCLSYLQQHRWFYKESCTTRWKSRNFGVEQVNVHAFYINNIRAKRKQ